MDLRKNVASQTVVIGPIYDLAGAPVTGLTTANVRIVKDNAASAASGGTLTADSTVDGLYRYTFTQAETNAGIVTVILYAADVNCRFSKTFFPTTVNVADFLNEVAAAVLSYNAATVEGTAAARSLARMIAASPAGKWEIVSGVFTVYDANDDVLFTKDLTTTEDVDPATALG